MKKLLRAMLFVCLMVGVIMILNQVTLNRRSEGCIQLSDFYKLEKNQVDLLCLGSSHVYYGINTCQLYDDYGIASYLLASPGQPVWISYYLLEEALKTQAPKLVLLDIGTIYRKEEDFGAYSWETLISMKPSREKWKAIQAVNRYGEEVDAAGAFFSFPYYHNRYVTLTDEDYNNTEQIRYNGYRPEFTTISESELSEWEVKRFHAQEAEEGSGEKGAITERAEYYLRKFIELCRDRKIQVLLVNSPFANLVEEKWLADDYIKSIAEEYGVALIEGNECVNDMQINFAEDLLDASHLNYYGSVKYTDYLAAWMEKNCSLPDRRDDIEYHAWEIMSDLFWRVEIQGRTLQDIHTSDTYIEALKKQPDGRVAVCWEQDGMTQVYDSGKCVFRALGNEDYFKYFDLGASDLAVSCADGNTAVLLDQEKYSFVEEGTNILVYDRVAERVIDGVGFDKSNCHFQHFDVS